MTIELVTFPAEELPAWLENQRTSIARTASRRETTKRPPLAARMSRR